MCGISTNTISFSWCSVLVLREQIFQDRNLRQARNSGQRLGPLVFHDAAEHVDFSVLQADLVLNLALTDDWLADAADADIRGHGGNVERTTSCEISRSAWTRGVMSMLTPTSMYWN